MAEFDLDKALEAAQERANRAGALVPLETTCNVVREAGLALQVRWVSSLQLKDSAVIPRAGDKPAADFNPFLPYEEALFVANVSPTHVVLLNKFPVIPGHVLIITREFAEQRAPLDEADFAAVALLLQQKDGLVFCNGGPEAGASQRHKHLQLTPAPALIEPMLPQGVAQPRALAELPFANAFVSLDEAALAQPARLRELFDACCAVAGIDARDGLMSPYNLLLTRRWLLLVPRSHECWEGEGVRLSINAMGYAGSIVLRQQEQFEAVRRAGIFNILASVSGPQR